jgi:lipoprotein-releasing system permease protein
MKFEFFIAMRYLFSKHKLNFITIISYLSLSGIMIGTAALILVLAVFNGFGSLVTSYLINFDPHLRIDAVTENGIKKWQSIDSLLLSKSKLNYTPFVNGKVLVKQESIIQVVNLKGISNDAIDKVYGINNSIVLGKANFDDDKLPGGIIGVMLADKLHAMIGDTLSITSPTSIENSILSMTLPKSQKVVIRGIYSSNNNEYDASYIFISLKAAQSIFRYKNDVQGFELKLSDIELTEATQDELLKDLGIDYTVSTWYDFHKELFSVMQIERWVAYILLSLIIAVAVFNILGSLTMSVIEKKRDIGVMLSMGADQNSITRIFMYQGLLVGLTGTISGFILGIAVYLIHLKFNIYPLDPLLYRISALPMQLNIADFLTVGFASIGLSFAAAIYPAKMAAKLNPVESIKWE